MKLIRMFSKDKYKGQRNYLDSQKRYELLRTILYLAISLSLFAVGWIQTGRRENLLTIVAVLGCLPACKSMVEMIMFLRFRSCSAENADKIEQHSQGLSGLFDLVFTSYEANFVIDHMAVRGRTICGFTGSGSLKEQAFGKHLDSMLKKDGIQDVSIKIFKDIKKYTDRLEQMKELPEDESVTADIISTIKSISL